jgi:hypothetical protein
MTAPGDEMSAADLAAAGAGQEWRRYSRVATTERGHIGRAALRPRSRAAEPRRRGRIFILPLLPLIAYFAARPLVASDAAALAIAGVLPAVCTISLAVVRRRIEPWTAAPTAAFALACFASLLANGSSLPMKLHEAALTFLLGILLLAAVLAGCPLPIGRVFKTPTSRQTDRALGAIIGTFLILHSLLHLALALTLSTATYVIAGRVTNWVTIGFAVLLLSGYLHHLRQQALPPRSADWQGD